jgi:hypothetical protein
VIYRHPNWLQNISSYFNTLSPNMLIMPVDFKNQSGLLAAFQITENLALTGITAGFTGIERPFMCNGANLAFKKSVYEAVLGYDSHLHTFVRRGCLFIRIFQKNRIKIHSLLIIKRIDSKNKHSK